MTFDPRFCSERGVQMILVTPDLAREWLKNNNDNRRIRYRWIANLAAQMVEKQYVDGASVISFATSGRLLNGQHTLNAIIMSNTSHVLTVQYGMPEESFVIYDRGINRTLSDVTKIDSRIIAILRILDIASRNDSNKFGSKKMSPKRTIYLYEKCKEAIDYICSFKNWRDTLKPAPIPAAFVGWYYFTLNHEDNSWSKIILRWLMHDETIVDLMQQPQIINAWNHFVRINSSLYSSGSDARAALFYKAWNVFDYRCVSNRRITAANSHSVNKIIMNIFGQDLIEDEVHQPQISN